MKAKLVTVTLTTRVIVNDDATEEDIINTAKHGIVAKAIKEIHENVSDISDDNEMPVVAYDLQPLDGCECNVVPCQRDVDYYDNLQPFTGTLKISPKKIRTNYNLVTVIDGNDDAFSLEVDSIHSIL